MAKGTTTQSNEPYGPAKGLIGTTINDANKLYTQGLGGSFWTGPTSAPLSTQQREGLTGMEGAAKALNPWMQDASSQLNMVRSAGPGYSERNLGDVASGKFLGGADPFFEDVLNTSGRKAMDAVSLQAGQMGRSGSTANMDAIARTIGELQMGERSNQYNRERGYQMSANQMLDDQRNMGLDRRLAAFDRMPAAFNYAMMPGQVLRDVGGEYQGQAQNVLDDQIRMFDASQIVPWEQLGRMNAIAQGMGGLGGTQTQRQSGGLGGFLGNLVSLAGML